MKKCVIGIDEVGRAVSKRRASSNKFIIGIDEVGRGPLAGPMVIGAVLVSGRAGFLYGIRDSKKLSPDARERWYKIIVKNAECKSVIISPTHIDKYGLSKMAKNAIARLLQKFDVHPDEVLLDGGLKAPAHFVQKTIIKGDEKIPAIAAASIIAKVTRDRIMVRAGGIYPKYEFAQHKGYGTRAHFAAIKKHGLSKIHRKSFCTRVV